MPWNTTRLSQLLNIEYPIIQAPMAGASTPAMALAATRAGGLGSLGTALQGVDAARRDIAQMVDAGAGPFNANFFVHQNPIEPFDMGPEAQAVITRWYQNLDAGPEIKPHIAKPSFDDQTCDMLVELRPHVVSFHFGLPESHLVERLKAAGIIILSSATSVKEAQWLEQRGADAIIAQGAEAGGHSGWFIERGIAEVAGTMALVPRMVDAVDVPIIAAGGIADGRGIAAAMMLGASGVQIGTAFLPCSECASPDVHKQSILTASGDDTVYSKGFSGRRARTIVNQFARDMADVDDMAAFPLMNPVTGPLRAVSANQGRGDAVSLWAGQGVGLVTETRSVTKVFEDLITQADDLLA
ncbi:2-nitropropane dioxygenase [Amylibacter marinus]|uniref:Propionate 3-nitronate monooxygenase n=1 Tax=Amylibacter marinus TaxID=1475483 RepID=A0ABQ5VSR9_9RHOB|nr:nitronate monooxygenase family protein [Amylibacter marinus]GLQ34330.1 2-nitropropane dioxygenase [Amylibacter marinus]